MTDKIFKKRFQKYLCTSCGVCAGVFSSELDMKYEKKIGKYVPTPLTKYNSNTLKSVQELCPGFGYNITMLKKRKSKELFIRAWFISFYFCRSKL